MPQHDPADGEAAGIAAFNMMIELVRTLHAKKVIDKQAALKIFGCNMQTPPMPGTTYRVTEYVHRRLIGQVEYLNTIDPIPRR